MPSFSRPPDQLWMLYLLECPLHTQMFKQKHVFNWTSTYRKDSTIVAPYERWQYYNDNVKSLDQNRDFAANKTKAVAWFVSNCGARNGRLTYAKELSKYIQVMSYLNCYRAAIFEANVILFCRWISMEPAVQRDVHELNPILVLICSIETTSFI